jgi:hypothetical protein
MTKLVEPIVFRLNSFRLDTELAAGQAAETSARHARRASMLVAPSARRSLAAGWEHLLTVATRPARGISGRVPIRRRQVLLAEPEIRDLIDALNAIGPVPVQGVALARLLLTDGTGPVYNPAATDDLAQRVGRAVLELDPARPLMAARTPAAGLHARRPAPAGPTSPAGPEAAAAPAAQMTGR